MIKIDQLSKHYQDFDLNLSLEVPESRVTGIVGRNGAGKSTTIKAILGLVKPDSGTVTVFGKDSAALSPKEKERLGVALAESGFSQYLTVEAIAHILRGMYPSFDQTFFMRQVKEQKLPTQKPIQQFSTGMKAKLRVLVAISHKAELLILDEPTSGLDVLARNDILDLLRCYLAEDERRSLLITSHISSDLEGLCDDIYMIYDGKVILHEDTDELLNHYAVLKVSPEAYAALDKTYLLSSRETSYGYLCVTKEKQFYLDNYPEAAIEKGGIDELLLAMAAH